MASALYESIQILSREKGIDAEIVVAAVEDAIALATRKYHRTQETMRAELDRETGEIRAYVYKTVVEGPDQLEDELNQLTLEQARELAPEVEAGGELRFYKDTSPLGRIAAQVGPIYYHTPSLVQHIGLASTWGGQRHQTNDFMPDWRGDNVHLR